MIRIATALVALAFLASSPGALAATEQGDAGDLPASAQDLSAEPAGALDGQLASEADIDVYRLCLAGDATFSAGTVWGTTVDTQLFLFDAEGRGVYANDDLNDAVRQSLLPAQHDLTPRDRGTYYLAIGAYNLDPRSDAGSIFPAESGVVGPVSPGGDQPITGWEGRSAGPGPYSISLTGECTPPDNTPPAIDLSPADGAVFGRGDRVEVHYSCADEEGGSGLASCVGTVPDGHVLDTSDVGPQSVTVVARDNAGNERAVTHTVTVVAIDRTPPAIELVSPFDGAIYLLDQDVRADYSCAEEKGGSGLVSCTGDVAVGERVGTGSVGTHEFGVDAADAAGNTAHAGATYRVIYDFKGFLKPLRNRPEVNRWKAGVPVPVRFELGGRQGRDVIEGGWPQVAEVDCDFDEEPSGGEPVRHPKKLSYSKRKQRYRFLWKTDRRWAGSCRQFLLKLNDGTIRRADFKFTHGWSGRD